MNFEELIRERNEENPFAKLCGIRTLDIQEGYAKGEVILGKEHTNVMGAVHGGMLFSIADVIAGSAAQSHGEKTVTVSADVKFLRGVLDSKKLVCEVKEIKNGRFFSIYDAEIYDDKDILVFKGTFEYFKVQK